MPRNYFTPQEKEAIRATRAYVLNYLHKPLHPQTLAQVAGISSYRLNEGFRHHFERSLAAYIHETRLQTARFLLLHTHKSVKEIAIITGYRHQQNFQNAFRRFFGTAPGTYRQQHT